MAELPRTEDAQTVVVVIDVLRNISRRHDVTLRAEHLWERERWIEESKWKQKEKKRMGVPTQKAPSPSFPVEIDLLSRSSLLLLFLFFFLSQERKTERLNEGEGRVSQSANGLGEGESKFREGKKKKLKIRKRGSPFFCCSFLVCIFLAFFLLPGPRHFPSVQTEKPRTVALYVIPRGP